MADKHLPPPSITRPVGHLFPQPFWLGRSPSITARGILNPHPSEYLADCPRIPLCAFLALCLQGTPHSLRHSWHCIGGGGGWICPAPGRVPKGRCRRKRVCLNSMLVFGMETQRPTPPHRRAECPGGRLISFSLPGMVPRGYLKL